MGWDLFVIFHSKSLEITTTHLLRISVLTDNFLF